MKRLINWKKLGYYLGEALGALSLFGIVYLFLLFAYALGYGGY